MFDFAWSEFALIGIVALLVIGPKDMPVAIGALARVVRKARQMAGEFQTHVDEMVRDADLGEVRDQVRELRGLNVRNRILKTIDGDGTLRRTIDDPTLRGPALPPAGPKAALPAPGTGGSASSAPSFVPPLPVETSEFETSFGASPPGVFPYPDTDIMSVPDAPAILPPSAARRVAGSRERLSTPSILPPVRVLHGHRRVAPFAAAERQDER